MSRKSSIRKIKRSNEASKNIEASLVMELYQKGHSPISTHAAIYGLQECDVISISKADYIYEYEVKISRSDFKQDFKKPKHEMITEGKHTSNRYVYVGKNKNKEKDIWYHVPNYFYFVVPEGLVSVDEVPDYAGLIYIKENSKFETIKKAPIIHKTKASQNFIRALSHQLTCKLVFKKVS